MKNRPASTSELKQSYSSPCVVYVRPVKIGAYQVSRPKPRPTLRNFAAGKQFSKAYSGIFFSSLGLVSPKWKDEEAENRFRSRPTNERPKNIYLETI